MAEITEVISYIVNNYPYGAALTEFKLLKILYLADWKSSIDRGRQLTNIEWKIGRCGLEADKEFKILEQKNSAKHSSKYSSLTESDRQILNHVINTSKQSWTDFVSIVYSTYPILNPSGIREKPLDLVSLAQLYQQIRTDQAWSDRRLLGE